MVFRMAALVVVMVHGAHDALWLRYTEVPAATRTSLYGALEGANVAIVAVGMLRSYVCPNSVLTFGQLSKTRSYNYLILRSQKLSSEIDSPELFRNIKMLTFCKSIGTEYLMINRAKVGNFATLKNSISQSI